MLTCRKCNGRVFIDRAYSNQGRIELSCIECGKRWELHESTTMAKILTKIERRKELGINENVFLSKL